MINNTENINYKNSLIDYLIKNEIYFISLLNEFNKDYSKIPPYINFFPIMQNDIIDSLIGYTDAGHYYINIKESYTDNAINFINSKLPQIFSLYGESKTISSILNNLNIEPINLIEYNVMFLEKSIFKYFEYNINGFYCNKCGIINFDDLKKIQELYHKEEVYEKNSYYPYFAEMNSFKELLQKKLTYGVYTIKNNRKIYISKANVNGETPNLFQLGGIFTQYEYRGKGLALLCLNNMIKDIFDNYNKKGISLFVKKNNISAINLYLKLGFKKIFDSSLCYF